MTFDPAHEAWVRNAAKVEKNPKKATEEQLKAAIEYVRYEQSKLIFTARKRNRPASAKRLAELAQQLVIYTAMVSDDTADA